MKLFSANLPRISFKLGFLLFVAMSLFFAVFSTLAADGAAAAGKILGEKALRTSIRTGGFARVLVRLNAPETKRLEKAAFAHRTITPGRGFSRAAAEADKALSHYIRSMTAQVVSGLPASPYRINRTYDFFPVVAMDVSGRVLDYLKASLQVSTIMEDRPVPLPPTEKGEVSYRKQPSSFAKPQVYPTNTDTIGAEAAWAKGYTGAGWYVAILDSGVLTSHESFAGKNIVEACFSHTFNKGTCPNGKSTMYGAGAARPFINLYSGYDHGTHVAGIAAGNSGSAFGVAKDANIIAVQIFSPFTASECTRHEPCVMTWDSDQLAALDYILSVRDTYPIAAVNMSIGSELYSDQASCDSGKDTPMLKYAIDELRDAGIATVSVSGNDSSCDSMEAPGCISSAIGVGAVDDSDQEAFFNDWQYNMLDLLAPGVNIYSASPDSPTAYKELSGTSMAAPQVTGAWAILKQKDPAASVSDILYILESTGVPIHTLCSGLNDYKPRINVDSALSPFLIPVPSGRTRIDYAPTDSPIMNVQYLPYPIGVGPIAGDGDIINVKIGLYAFSAPVDIYAAVYAPATDPDNYYLFTPDGGLKPFPLEGLDENLAPLPWKSDVTGPIDESLTGDILSSQLPVSTYYLYLLVTPPGRMDTYYLLSTSFVNNGS